jgi:NarL family two-component system response regulator LiaR
MDRIRILVVEDDARLRRALVELLRLEPEFDVVADAGDGEMALQHAGVLRPDVLLTDLEMPRLDGISLIRRVQKLLLEVAVVVLTKFGDDERVFGAIKAGAVGYLLKDAGLDEIAQAVRMARSGEAFLSPALVARVMAEFARVSKTGLQNRRRFAELSRREVEVLECLAVGMRNAQIADKLSLSEKTVKSHVGAILKKLHANDREEAGRLAREGGLEA